MGMGVNIASFNAIATALNNATVGNTENTKNKYKLPKKPWYKKIQHWWWSNVSYKISNWFYYDSPIYIDLNIYKIFSLYLKARKVFIKPQIVKHVLRNENDENSLGSDYFYLKRETYNKWLHISCEPLGWKSKYSDYRFESVPYFTIVWRNKTRWVWGLEAPLWEELFDKFGSNIYYRRNNDLYWETIMNYVFDKLTPLEALESNRWVRPIWNNDKEKPEVLCDIPITPFQMFTAKYKSILAEKISNRKRLHEQMIKNHEKDAD